MPTLYAAGTTPIAVTPRGFAVLEPGASASLLARIRGVVGDGRGLGGVIEALTAAYGASLTAIPSFAVALADGEGVRIAVRGDFVLEVDAASPERVSGAGVTTWTERVVADVARVTLSTAELDASAPAELEIADGIVLAAAIVWDAAAPRSAAVAAPSVPARASATSGATATPEPSAGRAPSAAAAVPAPSATPVPAASASSVDAASSVESQPHGEPAAPGATPGAEVIDAGAVPSPADGETLLPSDSALLSHEAPARAAGGSAGGSGMPMGDEDDEDDVGAGFDNLWGATVIRPGDEAPQAPEVAAPAPAVPAAPAGPAQAAAGDHDGATISLAQARALRAQAAADAEFERTEVAVRDSPQSPVPLDSLAPPRPPAPGRVRVSTGQEVLLDRTVVIGRRPRSTRVSGTDLPHLVAVDSPQQDISRSHVELRVEGESIVATDLRTTNGTTLLRSGADPVRLHPGEGTVVVPGDVLDLGDGITVAIEGIA